MSDLTFRPRTITELVDAAFRLYRQHFVQLITLATIAYFPVIIVVIAFVLSAGGLPGEPGYEGLTAMTTVSSVVMGLAVIAMIFWYPAARAAMNVSVSEAYHGRVIDAGTAIRHATSRYGTLLAAWFGKWVIVTVAFVVGIFLLGAPGFYFLARFFAIPSTVVIEDTDVGSAFGRSSQLALGYKWRILGATALGWALLFALYMAVTMILVVVLALVTVSGGSVDDMDSRSAMLLQLPNMAAYIVGLPLTVIIETLLYYDMRIRQEGYDLEVMSAQLATPETGAATA